MRSIILLAFGLSFCWLTSAQIPEADLKPFQPVPAPGPSGLLLKHGDRLAICGDSITEQRMYSRIMEDYLTVCVPDLEITVRQFGWSGERAPGFLGRMTNDCLRFRPTIATTCYGMNDHEYRTYEYRIGETYRESSEAIDEAFKSHGARVVEGSPGCVGKVPTWTKSTNCTVLDLNLNLCNLRNIGIEVARDEHVAFADVFWPMMTAGAEAGKRFGPGYAISGKDGVHPGWAGHTVMAYAFLKAFGLTGEIGTFTADLRRNTMKVSAGHELLSAKDGQFEIRSSRYPFCACEPEGQAAASYPVCGKDDSASDNSIRSAMTLIPFNPDLNRLLLVVKHGPSAGCRITWGNQTKTFSSEQLARGVNLAAEFPDNPFCAAFAKVDAAVAAKQAFETTQIKKLFRSPEAKTQMETIAAQSEDQRTPLATAIKAAVVPVTHTIKIEPAVATAPESK
jgi:hypothetical protein